MANHRTDTKGGTVKELKDTPETRGMIHKVRHLVEVE
jgi:ribosomal protein L30/L7E